MPAKCEKGEPPRLPAATRIRYVLRGGRDRAAGPEGLPPPIFEPGNLAPTLMGRGNTLAVGGRARGRSSAKALLSTRFQAALGGDAHQDHSVARADPERAVCLAGPRVE